VNREIPESWDWVTARTGCTPYRVFENLRRDVENDVRLRNALSAQQGFLSRNFVLQGDGDWFAVVLQYVGGRKGVYFRITSIGVDVIDVPTNRSICEAALTISDDGLCRLKVGSVEYNQWQFRKLVLHPLFFEDREIIP
jgi:hypothetical protein